MASFGNLLRSARHLRGFSQKESAAKLGIAQAIFSRLENDLVEPDDKLLAAAASVFSLPVSYFSLSDTVYGPPVSVHSMLRGRADISAREVDRITAEMNLRLIHLNRFMQNVEFQPVNDIPRLDIEESESPQKVANTVRSHWRLPSGPIGNLTKLLERSGVVIALSDFGGAQVSGVTFAAPGRPPIILINQSHPADRLRFTLAHELGHLVMHRFPTPSMEEEANQFASAFLLPPLEMKQVFRGRKITLELLASLKREWRVSMQSLLMSASTVGAITTNQARYLWTQISSRGWKTREPVSLDFPFDAPSVLPAILDAHLKDFGFQVSELAMICHMHEGEFREFYGLGKDGPQDKPRLRIVA
ncbi:MAG: helix-turn-helix domain-containing protein [Yoonia sp.]